MGLFSDFDQISKKEWLDKINADLKGKDIDTLIWKSPEDIDVFPFYHSTDLATNISSKSAVRPHTPDWEVNHTITITDFETANQEALQALKGGVNSITFTGNVPSLKEMTSLLKGIQLDVISIHFRTSTPLELIQLFLEEVSRQKINVEQISGSVGYDMLGSLLTKGNWKKSEHNDVEELVQLFKTPTPFTSVLIEGNHYCNAGATITEELAFSISQMVEYFSILTENDIDPKDIAKRTTLTLGIGSNYFFEIAKFRAARILWKMVLKAYDVTEEIPLRIHAITSTSNTTAYESEVNILRSTSEAMSAITGGADLLTVLHHDQLINTSNEFSNRIARNIQILLKEESFLNKVTNPADGSYYIEYLTDEIAKKTWEIFQDVEKQGGFLKAIQQDLIQDRIKDTVQKKKKAFENNEVTLVGINKYVQADHKAIPYIAQNEKALDTTITPLPMYRVASENEKLRYQNSTATN